MDTAEAQVREYAANDAVTALQGDNDAHLDQLARFLDDVPPQAYRAANGADAAIGAHVRHVLEHYEILLRDAETTVDYDRRARDPEVEQCPRIAAARVHAARERLRDMTRRLGERTLPVACSCASDGTERPTVVNSSLARELLFLQSHTVHHLAIIAVFARQRGLTVPADFGVAPATRRHRG